MSKDQMSVAMTQLQGTKFLKTTGILDAYEHTISTMIKNGWPSDKSIFDHAAYEVLKWSAENKDSYRGLVGRNMEKKQDAIFASRDNIPELSQYKMMQEMERHKADVANDIKSFSRPERIQLKSRKQYNLSTNKLDVSIFQFRDRPIFKKPKEEIPPSPVLNQSIRSTIDNGGLEELKNTRPQKKPLAKVQKTDFSIDESVYKDQADSKSVMSAVGPKSLSPDKQAAASSIWKTEEQMYNTMQQPKVNNAPTSVNLNPTLNKT